MYFKMSVLETGWVESLASLQGCGVNEKMFENLTPRYPPKGVTIL